MSWDHYSAAVVRIGLPTGWVQIEPAPPGSTTGPFPDPAGRTIHVLTAHNPRGQHADARTNDHAHHQLLHHVQAAGHQPLAAAGADPTWTHVEESIAILGMTDADARALGHRFGQDAIFAWTPTHWTVTSCTDDRRSIHGWAARAAQGPTPTTRPASRRAESEPTPRALQR